MTEKKTGINTLEVLKYLNKSNCKKCGVPTCLAFATALINGEKKFSDCPHISEETAEELSSRIVKRGQFEKMEKLLDPLKAGVSHADFAHIAEGLGAELEGKKLRITCLGKDFTVDSKGNIASLIHVNTWVAAPLLKYIIMGGNEPLTGRWVSFGDLKRASSVAQYFDRRCEEPLRQLADSHTDIFFDLINIFGGREIKGFSADYARVFYPLPKVPFLILYWNRDDQFESKLRILLDSSADSYLDIEFIIGLGRGIVEMMKKIVSKHEELLPKLLAL